MDVKERCRRGPGPCFWALAAAAAVAALAAGCSDGQAPPSAPPAVPVSAATVVVTDLPVQARNIGTVTPYSSIVIRSQAAGPIVEVHVAEGALVKQGQLLFVIDPRPYQAALTQAQAALGRSSNQLDFARRELQRVQSAAQRGAASPDEVDTAKTLVRTAADTVNVDKAAVESARLQLAYCYIYAPVEGVAGEVTIKSGNVIRINETALLTLNQIHPIYVNFTLPQRYLDEIRRYQLSSGALPLQAYVTDRSQGPSLGTLTFINNTVDMATGTILLKGTFPNADNRLWPGQFVEVALTLTVQRDAVLVPSRAVQTGQSGTFVFVIDSDLKARMRGVEVARTQEDQSVIARGLSGGETVVVDGQLRLVDGTAVQIVPELAPQDQALQGPQPTTRAVWATTAVSGATAPAATAPAPLWPGPPGIAQPGLPPAPLTPGAPGRPAAPGTPGLPQLPGQTPAPPAGPGTPETPQTPGTPGSPAGPGTPQTPQAPPAPQTPGVPGTPAAPGTPGGGAAPGGGGTQ